MPRSRSRSPRRRSELSLHRERDYARAEGPSSRRYSPRVHDGTKRSNSSNRHSRREDREDDRKDTRRRNYSRSRSPRRPDTQVSSREYGAPQRASRSRSPSEKPKPKLEPNLKNSGQCSLKGTIQRLLH